MVMVGLGCLLAMAGWLGLTLAGALLFGGVAVGTLVLVGLNTLVSSAFATLAAVFFTRLRFGTTAGRFSMHERQLVGGLVASSAGCASLTPITAAITGFIAGALVTSRRVRGAPARGRPGWRDLDALRLRIWGAVAVAIFASDAPGQWIAQLAGIATLLGFVLPISYAINRAIDRTPPHASAA